LPDNMSEKSFSITLISDEGLEFNPNNKPNNFTTNLYHPIQLFGNYRVTVTDLFFAPDFNTIVFSKSSPGLVDVTETAQKSFQFHVAAGDVLERYIGKINLGLRAESIQIRFTFTPSEFPPYDPVLITCKFLDPRYRQVAISEALAEVFGFSTNVIVHGQTRSVTTPSIEKFGRIRTESLVLTSVVETNTIQLIQKDGFLEVADLIGFLNEKLQEHHITFAVDETELDIEITEANFEFKFSENIRVMLGIEKRLIFNEKKSYLFPNEVKLTTLEDSLCLISTDVIENQFYAGGLKRLLRTFPFPKRNEKQLLIHQHFSETFYLPTVNKVISSIQVEIRNDKDSFVPLHSSIPTRIVLHFKSE